MKILVPAARKEVAMTKILVLAARMEMVVMKILVLSARKEATMKILVTVGLVYLHILQLQVERLD